MNDSVSRRLGFSAAFAVLLLIGGAVAIFVYLKDEAGPAAPGAGDSTPSVVENLPADDADATASEEALSSESPDASGEETSEANAVVSPPSGPLSIRGRVKDPDGTGIPGAHLLALNVEEWNRVLEEHKSEMNSSNDPIRMLRRVREILTGTAEKVAKTESGTDGAYAFHSLEEGDYRLFTTHDEYLPDDQSWALVEEGNPATVDVELTLGSFIAGRIVDGSAKPVGGATITAVPSYRGGSRGIGKMMNAFAHLFDGHMVMETRTFESAPDGTFRLSPIEPVSHDITVKSRSFTDAQALRVPPATEDVVIVVTTGLKITGQLLGPDLQPAKDAKWTLQPAMRGDITRNPLALAQADFDIFGENTRRGAPGQDGKFEISGLKTGSFVLRLAAEEHPELKLTVDARDAVTDLGELVLDEPLSIAGRVTDASGSPVADARIWIDAPMQGVFTQPGQTSETLAETISDGDGEFTLTRLARGTYFVQASSPGYAGGSLKDVEAGAKSVTITLADGMTLRGKVLDARDRSPIEDVDVYVVSGGRQRAVTDSDGIFEVRGIGGPRGRPGEPGFEASLRARGRVFVQFSHPNYSMKHEQMSAQIDEAVPLTEVLLDPVRQIVGTVVNAAGEPIRNARVRFVIPGIPEFVMTLNPGGSSGRVFSAADGSFSMNLPGRFGGQGLSLEIVASHPAYATGRIELGDPRQIEELTPEVEIVLTRGSSIEGRVVDTAAQPVNGAQIRLTRPVQLKGEALLMASMMPQNMGTVVYSRSDGSYRVAAVEEGEYRLEVTSPGHAKKVVDGVVVTSDPVTQDVVLDPGGSIQGVVVDTDDVPVANVEVVAFLDLQQMGGAPDDRMALEMLRYAGRGTSMARTNAEGRYSLRQLPEGEYTVVARASGFLPAEQPSLSPGDEAPELVLHRFARLRVVVIDGSTGNPVPEFRVQSRRQTEDGKRDPFGYQPIRTVSDGSGQYTREDLRPGLYHVGVTAKGFMPYFKEVTINEGEDAELSAVLTPGLGVVAVVVDGDSGEPISGARVHAYQTEPSKRNNQMSRLGLSENYATDGEGRIPLDSLGEGKYQASVSHPDYFPADDNDVNFELPADDGRELNMRMHPAGKLRGTLTNLGAADARSVGYQLMLTRQEEAPPDEVKSETAGEPSGEKRKKRRRPRSVEWVGVNTYNGGTFERESLRPGKYDVALKKYVYVVEDGRRRSREDEEPVPLGTIVIEPGATKTANFSVP